MNAVELKNLDRLQKSMTSLLKGFGISSVELGNEYAYYYISESVTFKLTYTLVDSWFDEFISKRFNIAIDDFWNLFYDLMLFIIKWLVVIHKSNIFFHLLQTACTG